MENFLRRLIHVLMVGTWLGASILAGLYYTAAGAALLALGVVLFWRALQRGYFKLPSAASEQPTTERDAKIVVTQVLRNLTRIQVSYLCQKFETRAQSRAWLKQALPRVFRDALDEMHSSLENARIGNPSPGLKLALRIVELREQLLGLEDSLQRAHELHPQLSVAHPVIYVMTEHISADNGGEPQVCTLASWDPSQPTLLPEVDTLAFLTELEGGKRVRGQTAFQRVREALADRIKRLDGQRAVYAAEPVEDPVRHGIALDKFPLGFMIGAAELL